jgi:predicted nuclease with TOPRIM domain
VSSNGSDGADAAALKRVQDAVMAALAEIDRLREEVSHAESQGAELDEMLRGVTAGEQSPREMIDRLSVLEEENRDLRERLFEGRTSVDRLLARIQFLEDQR